MAGEELGTEDARRTPRAAFIKAVGGGDVAAVKVFLAANPAAANWVNENDAQRPMLAQAVWERNNFDNAGKTEIVKLLLDHGAKVDAVDAHGTTACFYAAWGGNSEVTAQLLAAGANPNHRNAKQESALMYSGYHRAADVMELLIEKGADINAQDDKGWTPLMWAARGSELMAETLLKHGADVNLATDKGTTALGIAAGWGSASLARILLDAGAAPDSENKEGLTPRDISLKQTHNTEHLDIAGMVLDKQVEKIVTKVNEGAGRDIAVRRLKLKPKM